MLRKAISGQRGFFQLSLSTIGAALGFFILLAGLQFYFDLTALLQDKSQLSTTNFFVIHKQTTSMSMFGLKNNGFTNEEIEEIRQQRFIKEIGAIQPGLFKVSASMNAEKQGIKMNTDMFFEAVDDRFIDLKNGSWEWKKGDHVIPIILPSVLLESYNFGMAPSQNLPPLTEKTIKLFHYNIDIYGNGNEGHFRGRIAGFSDRINTILVPKAFIEYANEKYRSREEGNPAQLVIETDNIDDPELAKFLKEKNYETNAEKLSGSKMRSILTICLLVMLLLGIIIILLAALSFVQYARISLLKSTYELKVLMGIGYNYTRLAKVYVIAYLILTFLALALALTGLLWFKNQLLSYFGNYYFNIDSGIHSYVTATAIFTFFIFYTINVLSVLRLLRSLAKSLY